MKTPFLGGSYLARSSNLNAQRCVNLYPETNTEGGRDIGAFYGTPGLVEFADLGSSDIRGLYVSGNFLYVVMGNELFKVDMNGNSSSLGTLLNSGRVTFAGNADYFVIATGGTGYLCDGSTLSTIGGNYPTGAKTVAYIDGFWIAEEPDTQRFWQSDLSDPTTWDALNFASKEGAGDNLVSILADHRELWLFGERTTEVWYNAGTSPFAFTRVQGAFMEHGVAAPYSVAKLDNTVFWLGQDNNGKGMIYAASGYAPTRISTHAIEYAIAQYEDVSTAFAWTYQQEGHSFYCLTFNETTWCFDTTTKTWHERAYLQDDGTLTRHRANCCVMFGGDVLVGDYENGKIYRLDLDTYTDNGDEIKRVRSWGHITNNSDRVKISELEIVMETGVGLDGGVQGSDPQLMLRWSDDGGHRWSNEHWKSAGQIGEFTRRAVWRRLGISRDRTFELSMTDPVKVAWIGAELKGDLLR